MKQASAEAPQTAMCKGSIWRGLSKVLAADKLRPQLDPLLPEHARERLRDPPLSSAWVPYAELFPVLEGLYQLGGEPLCRSVVRRSAELEIMKILQSVVAATIRLFGATPHTLFSRINQIGGSSVKGVEFGYARLTDHSCALTIAFPGERDVPLSMFYGNFGSCEFAFSLTRDEGSITDVAYVANGRKNSATARAAWRPKR